MGLTMKKILNNFIDCDTFSLTGKTLKYNITISEEEYKKETEKMNAFEIKKYLEQYIEKYNITEKEFLNALKKSRRIY